MSEVVRGLVGGEVEIGEDDDPGRRMFEDLRPPSRMMARVEPLAELEAERPEQANDAGEEPPRATERVVIVVGPTEPEPILPRLLHLCRTVTRLPVRPLRLEDQVAGQVGR